MRAFCLDIDVVSCPIVRDGNGVALSSRNARLSPEGLAVATRFAAALKSSESVDEARRRLDELPLEIDYLVEDLGRRFAAVVIDGVRLIDNVPLPD